MQCLLIEKTSKTVTVYPSYPLTSCHWVPTTSGRKNTSAARRRAVKSTCACVVFVKLWNIKPRNQVKLSLVAASFNSVPRLYTMAPTEKHD